MARRWASCCGATGTRSDLLPTPPIGWTLPIDDTTFRIYVAGRVKNSGDIGRMRSKFNGKFWWDMTEREHQQFPGDYEAQVGQGR